MAKTSVRRTGKQRKARPALRRPLAALAIGSLGVLGMSGPVGAATSEPEFEGTYRGGQSVLNGDERCSFLGGVNFAVSALIAFERDDGADWGFTTRSCGTIGGDPPRVSIVGNFTIAAPGGKLFGSFGDSFILSPSSQEEGVRVNHITGGTGDFAGATGTCLQTNNVIDGNSLTGDVTCDITNPK